MTIRATTVGVLLGLVLGNLSTMLAVAEERHPTRAEFAKAMAQVKPGLKASQVRRLLGNPDDVRLDPPNSWAHLGPKTVIWAYGAESPNHFPTLGQVLMTDGRVDTATGAYFDPPSPTVISEAELRRLLTLLSELTPIDDSYNPRPFIKAANELKKAGRDKALAAVQEYSRVRFGWGLSNGAADEVILRLLFTEPATPEYLRSIGIIGLRIWSELPESADSPLLLHQGVPIKLDWFPTGDSARSYADTLRSQAAFDPSPLVPGNDPLALLPALQKSYGWPNPARGGFAYSRMKDVMRQLTRLIDTVYRLPEPENGSDWLSGCNEKELMDRWTQIVRDVSRLNIHWDAAQSAYVFKDGTQLPPVSKPIYKRRWWTPEMEGVEPVFAVTRLNPRWVEVEGQWHGAQDEPKSPVEITVSGNNKVDREPTVFNLPSPTPVSRKSNGKQDDRLGKNHVESIRVPLLAGERLTFELRWPDGRISKHTVGP